MPCAHTPLTHGACTLQPPQEAPHFDGGARLEAHPRRARHPAAAHRSEPAQLPGAVLCCSTPCGVLRDDVCSKVEDCCVRVFGMLDCVPRGGRDFACALHEALDTACGLPVPSVRAPSPRVQGTQPQETQSGRKHSGLCTLSSLRPFPGSLYICICAMCSARMAEPKSSPLRSRLTLE